MQTRIDTNNGLIGVKVFTVGGGLSFNYCISGGNRIPSLQPTIDDKFNQEKGPRCQGAPLEREDKLPTTMKVYSRSNNVTKVLGHGCLLLISDRQTCGLAGIHLLSTSNQLGRIPLIKGLGKELSPRRFHRLGLNPSRPIHFTEATTFPFSPNYPVRGW